MHRDSTASVHVSNCSATHSRSLKLPKELLRERGVDAFAMWADVERTLADDPRFDVATAKQRKDAFAVYCQQVAAPTSIASGPPAVDGKKVMSGDVRKCPANVADTHIHHTTSPATARARCISCPACGRSHALFTMGRLPTEM